MKNDTIYLRHILEAIEKLDRYLKDVSYESFLKNDILIDAVIRELEIIGEAAKNISDDFRHKNHNIPWTKITGLRNHLIHEYFGVNKKIIWETCVTDLKTLKNLIAPLLD